MINILFKLNVITSLIIVMFNSFSVSAAIALDRTRVIFDGDNKSVSLKVTNDNKHLPYLLQSWIENENNEKISSPFIILPPLQRIEPAQTSQMKIVSLPDVTKLNQEEESVFYLNVREIPPKSKKNNVMQIALQSRIKLFYRPKAIKVIDNDIIWNSKLSVNKVKDKIVINNFSPYFITITSAKNINNEKISFEPIMISPHSYKVFSNKKLLERDSFKLIYVNDFGGMPELLVKCQVARCTIQS